MDSIKVWVAALNGIPVRRMRYNADSLSAWIELQQDHLKTTEELKALGWTVDPYTLTPIQEKQS